MTDDEFKETPVGKAMVSFFEYIFTLIALMNQIDVSRSLTLKGVNWLAKASNRDGVDTARHDPFLHGLYIIGAWGSFEAMFDDYCVAILRGEPDLLDAERLEGIKVPITDLLSSDHEKPVRVYLALKQKLERSSGVTKYEEILKCVGLSAQVPDDISKAVHESQQIRHIWAHRAGRADARFVRAVPHLGFSTGDVVAISNQQARDYVQAVYVYGAVVLNRYRMRHGLLPLNAGEDNEHPFKASYTSLYPTNERANLDITGSPIPSVETPPDGGHLL